MNNKIRGASLLLGLVAVAVLALGGLAPVRPAGAAVNSLSIAPATQTVPPGAMGINVSVEADATAPGIGAFDIDAVYDSTLLRVTACTPIADGVCNILAGAAVKFTGKSAGGLTGSPLRLGTITFEAADTDGTSAIEVSVIQLTDPDEADITFAPPADGEVVIQQPPLKQGDVNCDNSVNSVDALLVLRSGAGLAVNQNEPCPDIGTVLTLAGVFGDVDCAGVANSVDALKILRFGAGLSVAQNEPPPCTDVGQVLPEAPETVDAEIVGGVLEVIGTNDDDQLTLRLNGDDSEILEIDVGDDGSADFSFDRALFTEIQVNARDGNDLIRIDEVNGPIVEPASILGANGNDTILGGSAIETIDGGDGDDFIDGGQANDIAFMGVGNDTFRWDPGDGSDVVLGDDGSDTLLFNGANGGETVDLSADGDLFTFFRQPGSITMDVTEVETSVFNALGGADFITVNDLTGTDVTQVDLNLENPLESGAGDGVQDGVLVNGKAGDDSIALTGSAGSVDVTGLSASVAISAAEAANDLLTINAGKGNDAVDASALQADAIKQLTVDGEGGADLILGGRGADILIGGAPVSGFDGDDLIDGNQANDFALLGAGDDTFRWDAGDGSDVVEGEDGSDTLLFNGANVAETVDLSADGERFIFFRQPGNITMDTNDVEISVFNALGGPDTITVNDLTGTDMTLIGLDLGSGMVGGAGDGEADQVVVNGTASDDSIHVNGTGAVVGVFGLFATVGVRHADAAIDRLDINTLTGTDTVDSSGLAPGLIQLFVDGVAQ